MRGALFAAALAVATPAGAQTLFIASDSTAQTYAADRYPQTGWGQMLPCGLTADAVVVNRAIGGRSTKSFLAEGRWDTLLAEAKPGDVVLIQFGHNDASTTKPERYAPAGTLYRDNLLRMIWEARGHGLVPVLVTPPVRRSFDGTRVKADFAAYSEVMRALVSSTSTPLLDLEARSAELVQRLGPEGSRKLYLHLKPEDKAVGFPKGINDDTHFSELGARAMADLVAQELKTLKLPIADKVLPERPDLTRATALGSTACR
ncbi:rhamnogalacturonan acetylesterase [Sphingomonas pituitosa]|uniref:rhamnogalacturonan acetylesterase n=1 Tax=Sphingomonas pituitosa TaxID=99597 RepID=UPI00082DD806|nr:rhamnogalacturonan acetylesterase [Sphingomonas pituitosa]